MSSNDERRKLRRETIDKRISDIEKKIDSLLESQKLATLPEENVLIAALLRKLEAELRKLRQRQ
jgi:hypothetical protein